MEAAQAITGPNALLRFLRASRDPPLPGGPSKIALAASAWRDPASEIPHLAEILRDWLLSAWSDGDRRFVWTLPFLSRLTDCDQAPHPIGCLIMRITISCSPSS